MSRSEWLPGLEHLNWMNDTEQRAWQGQVKVIGFLFAQIGRELADESGLSFVDYEVLITLADAREMKLAMSELAISLGWSRSRASHQVKRMEARGLVQRIDSTADKRGADAYLTDSGLAILKQAVPGQIERVRKHFVDVLTDEQVAAMADICQTLLNHLVTVAEFPVPSRFDTSL